MAAHTYGWSVESRASSYVRITLLYVLVRVPLVDTLDRSYKWEKGLTRSIDPLSGLIGKPWTC